MKSNFALRTLVLLAAWLFFENFNLLTVEDARCAEHALPTTTVESKSTEPGSASPGSIPASEAAKVWNPTRTIYRSP